jgi:hypothetical protein
MITMTSTDNLWAEAGVEESDATGLTPLLPDMLRIDDSTVQEAEL